MLVEFRDLTEMRNRASVSFSASVIPFAGVRGEAPVRGDRTVAVVEHVLRIADRFKVTVDPLIHALNDCGPFERAADRHRERVAVGEFDGLQHRRIIHLHELRIADRVVCCCELARHFGSPPEDCFRLAVLPVSCFTISEGRKRPSGSLLMIVGDFEALLWQWFAAACWPVQVSGFVLLAGVKAEAPL